MLNLLALLTFLLAVAAVVVRLGRLMSRGGARADAGQIACVVCGTLAAALTSFTCPTCRGDVREAGLTSHAKSQPSAPLWALMCWTLVVLAIGVVVTGVAGDRLGIARQEFETNHTTNVRTHGGNEGINLSMRGHGVSVGGGVETVELVADLSVLGGGYASLEVEGPPLRGRLLDATGAPTGDAAPLDLPLVLRWFEAAGADPESALADHEARAALVRIGERLRAPIQVPPSRRPRPRMYSSSGGGGGSRNGGRVPPDWLRPASLMFWSAVWVAIAFRVTRPWKHESESLPPAGEDSPPLTPAGGGAA